jgi:hypothetical protein
MHQLFQILYGHNFGTSRNEKKRERCDAIRNLTFVFPGCFTRSLNVMRGSDKYEVGEERINLLYLPNIISVWLQHII